MSSVTFGYKCRRCDWIVAETFDGYLDHAWSCPPVMPAPRRRSWLRRLAGGRS